MTLNKGLPLQYPAKNSMKWWVGLLKKRYSATPTSLYKELKIPNHFKPGPRGRPWPGNFTFFLLSKTQFSPFFPSKSKGPKSLAYFIRPFLYFFPEKNPLVFSPFLFGNNETDQPKKSRGAFPWGKIENPPPWASRVFARRNQLWGVLRRWMNSCTFGNLRGSPFYHGKISDEKNLQNRCGSTGSPFIERVDFLR